MSAPSPRRIRFADRLSSPGWVLLTGLALGLSFPPSPVPGLALVALVPLLARWSRRPAPVMLFREAYAAFLLATAVAGYWVLFHVETLKALLLGLGLLAFPAFLALPVVASGYVLRRFGRVAGVTALGAGWLAMEHALVAGPVPFPWMLLGHTQAEAILFNQIADLGGVGALSLWVLVVNFAAFAAVRTRGLTPRFAITLVAVGLVLAPVGYRGWRLTTLPAAHDTASVLVTQPALPASSWSDIAGVDRVQALADLSEGALRSTRPDLVVWPEGALPVFPDARLQHTLYARLASWSARQRVPLLTGAVTRFDTAPDLTVEPFLARQAADRQPYYNSALLFDEASTQQYDRIHMLPVADRVPTPGWIPGQSLGVMQGFGPGGRQTVFRSGRLTFSTLVGFESYFGDHARRAAPAGAEFLTVIANTGWWNSRTAQRQHLALTRLRAIETRRAVVLASVAGGSGVILPDGRAPGTAGWQHAAAMTVSVPLRTDLTVYARTGDVIYRLGTAVSVLLALAWGLSMAFSGRPRAGK